MINYEKQNVNGNDVVTLSSNNSQLRFCKQENNVEWIFTGHNGDNTFVITMDDYEIYEPFLNLYNAIATGKIIDEDELREFSEDPLYGGTTLCDYNTEVKNTNKYKKLFQNGVITYTSDGPYQEEADYVTISKGEDYFMLEFKGTKPSSFRVVKFVKNDLNFFSLSRPFIKHYDEMTKVDLSYHQINFYDILKMKKSGK